MDQNRRAAASFRRLKGIFMKHTHLLFALSLGLAAMASEALAVGTFVPAAGTA